jgi:uncharacterized protein YecT (DUF1311 family)
MKPLIYALLLFPGLACAGDASPPDHEQAYSTCLDASGGINNGSVDACSSAVSEAATIEMTHLYRQLYGKLLADAPDDAVKLDRAQKSWLIYRDLHCALAGSHVGSPMYSFCPMQLNISRVGELRELLGQ